jgi:protein phosphatase
MKELRIPKLSLVVMIGASGSGKSSFAKEHFLPTEVLSSDRCRALVADDECDQAATKDAFEVLHYIAAKRLAAGRLTVVDATNVQREARLPLVQLAREFHVIPVAIVLDLPEKTCTERNRNRSDRDFGHHVVHRQRADLRSSMRGLDREGFRHIFILRSEEEAGDVTITRVPLWNDRREDHGPFDIIGDVHGCCDELEELLALLGYRAAEESSGDPCLASRLYSHPAGRKAVFLGDLVDRGPRVLDTLRLVRSMVNAGSALCLPGNHDMKFLRRLKGKNVRITYGLEKTLAELESLPPESQTAFSEEASKFLDSLVSHYLLDDGKLVVAHGGMKEELQGRGSGRVREFALYGDTTGETDEFGLPVRHNWAMEYRGRAMVVYGHVPVPEPEWLNRTINIDTGCVFGGKLTALRYPEKELVSVDSRRKYCEPARPFLPEALPSPALSMQQQHDDLLDAEDVIGKRIITTRLRSSIIIREENAAAALEVMSRFAADPRWLIYLPPTMSPCETASIDGYLEYPAEAFSYYRSQGVETVICEEKHMGSRAVIIICRSADAARRRFGVAGGDSGIIYTRTGRRFFENREHEETLTGLIREALDSSGFWEELSTDWVCLDCELMPWSAKAVELLKTQYAAVGVSAETVMGETIAALERCASRKDLLPESPDPSSASCAAELLSKYRERLQMVSRFRKAYRRYCWPVKTAHDFRVAPFHILATEGKVHTDRDHLWHMNTIAGFCARGSPVLTATPYITVNAADSAGVEKGAAWWEALTGRGGEGMVVKPLDYVVRGRKGLSQPAVKVRGREYLRIIYGPEYTLPENLARLRSRSLATKRSLAIREMALGIEALERFVRREPLRKVHECVFGILANESEPVDPRL